MTANELEPFVESYSIVKNIEMQILKKIYTKNEPSLI